MTDPTTRIPREGPDPITQPVARVEPRTPVLGQPAVHPRPTGPRAAVGARHAPRAHAARALPRLSALLTAALGVVLLAMLARFSLGSVRGQRLDESALAGAEFGRGTLWQFGEPVLDVVSVSFVVIVVGASVLIAFARRRWALAVQVALLVGGSNITTQLLKHRILEREDLGVLTERPGNSLPSGHTTVAASVSMALLLVVPRRMRPLVALAGATYTALTGVSTMIGGWHRPSDVVAALLVVLVWTAFALMLTTPTGLDHDGSHAIVTSAIAATLLGAGTVIAAALAYGMSTGAVSLFAQHGPQVVDYVTTALAAVATTGAVFTVGLLLRQSTARGRHVR